MPKKVVAYACKYKCGRRVTTKKDDMLRHEREYCFNNPAVKACPTCQYDDSDTEEHYLGHKFGEAAYSQPYLVRFCSIEKRPKGKKMIYECEHWKPKFNADD